MSTQKYCAVFVLATLICPDSCPRDLCDSLKIKLTSAQHGAFPKTYSDMKVKIDTLGSRYGPGHTLVNQNYFISHIPYCWER